jgi:alkyldihydroxyacetonephosphate synthase
MKRWNGWGEETTIYPLRVTAARYLASVIGEGTAYPDATWKEVLATVPPSRLPEHLLISTDAAGRLRHARGQSLPDWVSLRSGRIETFPDGVAYPASEEEVRTLLTFARETGVHLIPYGGGSSVVGHINPMAGERPTLTVNLTRLNRLLALDETSHLATLEAGASGPEVEAQLQARGYTLGHYPQSFEFSTLGGWIATRSSGQQSYYYGRIENLFAGGSVETPAGRLELPPLPASAAGPDLRHLILGSEGRLGVITEATVRVRPRPEQENFHAVVFRDWPSGVTAVRAMAQAGVDVSMMRLSNGLETETTLALAGHEEWIALAKRGLALVGYGPESCLFLFGVTGSRSSTGLARRQTVAIARDFGGLPIGTMIGKQWQKSRFLNPYLRNTAWEIGYAIDTLETAVPWTLVEPTAEAVLQSLQSGLAEAGERVLAFAHLSHVYRDGASIYITYVYRRAADPAETLRRWQRLKGTASHVLMAQGGTISHQHGVGLDHAPYLAAEKGELGMRLIAAGQRTLDPDGIMNPGKLMEESNQ